MAKITEMDVLEIIQKTLNINKKNLTVESSMRDVEEWDSLGHLGILSALDKLFSGKVANIKDMATADSIRKILQILKDESLI